jgi:hypothetical protein
VIISKIVLTVITQAPWSSTVTGRSGGNRISLLGNIITKGNSSCALDELHVHIPDGEKIHN